MTKTEIQEIRDFNRFYTSVIGLLNNHILDSQYSLPEARLIFELFNRQPCTATDILQNIKIDKGYLSRILKIFEKKGLLSKRQSKEDGRVTLIFLTAKGKREYAKINTASIKQIEDLMRNSNQDETQKVIHHMKALKQILSKLNES